jgi:DNA-binding transcriptional LysR family regulator
VPKLQQLLTDFSARFPATALTIKSVPSNGVTRLINLQQADLGLMFCDVSFPHEVDLCYLGCVDFVAIVAANHSLAESDAVSAADLIAHRQLLMVNTEQEELIQLPPLSANIWYCDSFHTLHALVEQGLGWSYLPIHMIEQEISANKLKILAVTFDHKPWNVAVDRVMQKNQASGPALSWLSEQMKNIFD